jgi:heat shock protein 4
MRSPSFLPSSRPWRYVSLYCSETIPANTLQDWLYEDGEDASKAQYISKRDEIRSIAGPIIQRYNDKVEEERQAVMKKQQEAHAQRQAEIERKKREEEAKKQAEAPEPKDAEMTDAETTKPDEVEEPAA